MTDAPETITVPPWSDAIDVHHHIVPPSYRAVLSSRGIDSPVAGVAYPSWRPEDSLDMMDRQGIAAAVLSMTEPGVHFADRALAIRLARETNEYMAGLVADYPHRFGAFAVLPLPDVDAAMEELTHALDVLGLDGVGLFTNYRGVYLGDDRLEELIAELDRRQIAIHAHPSVPPATDQPSFDLPASLYEFTFETTRLAAQLLYSGTLERHPDLRMILSHAGGAVPYLAERLTLGPVLRPALAERATREPIKALQRLRYDVAMSGSPYSLPALNALVPASQVLLGTDFPFMPEWSSMQNTAALFRYGGFADQDLARIGRGNAIALFPRLRAALA